jgi:hypothetical protein
VTPDARPIDRIAKVLASTGAPGTFATRRTASTDELHLDVVGVGPIPLPMSTAIARRLCDIAHPARYGLRDQTLLDRNVRDAWEIGKRQVKIDARRWRRTLDPALEHIARDLGLLEGRALRAELHNLLVYGPGQFFAAHQDSEKADGMIGTLVVLLPSESKGGALVIEHHDEKVSYRGSADRLALVAFYADCHHAVRPVTAGYRAALTYNLFLEGAMQRVPARPIGRPLDTLVDLVRAYFATPRPPRGPGWPSEGRPERLVYLLDHEYTRSGLAWDRLKNGDAVRAALLREVADRLDCEIVLALADVHETWSCEDDWGHDDREYGWRTQHRRYDDLDEEDEDEDDYDDADDGAEVADHGSEDYTLIELCDSSIELRHWLAPSGKRVQAISDEVLDDEVCYTKASVEFDPFTSEHEGYTGNAGNTVDRWYHRAAVMLWPRARTFAIRAKASPAWAIREIAKALARGSSGVARAKVGEVIPFWSRAAASEQEPSFVDQILRVAAEVGDAELAAGLVEPLEVERVTPRMAPRCVDLLARYGPTWCWAAFERWTSREGGYGHKPRATWIASLPELCGPLREAGGGDAIELARRLARSQWTWVDKRIRLFDSLPSSAALRDLVGLSEAVVGVLATAEIAGDRELQTMIVERLSPEQGYPTHGAIAVLRSGLARGAATLGLGRLHEDCTHTLNRLLNAPARGPGDWSIAAPLRCTCELCKRLARFLLASNEQQFDWPLATDRRAHVHQTITHHELPVTHVPRRVGSPYVLVLTKTKALFTREAAERKTRTSDLAWLTRAARSFGAPVQSNRPAITAPADRVEARPRRRLRTRR